MEIDRWVAELTRLHERIAGCFVRPEPRQRALRYRHGLLGPAVRKNGWQGAEQIGETTPTGVQRLLREAHWEADAVTDEIQRYSKHNQADFRRPRERLGARGSVLVMDETAFRKKGTRSAGVKRQYCGTTGQVENCQVGIGGERVPRPGAVPAGGLARRSGTLSRRRHSGHGGLPEQAGAGPPDAAAGQRRRVPPRLDGW